MRHKSLADQIRVKKRRALAISILAVLGTYVLLLTLGVIALTWATIVGFLVYFRMTRTNMYIVWLRPFHQNDTNRLRFNMLLNRACPGMCIPITIQDSVFKTSYYSSFSRMVFVIPVVFGIGALFSMLCFFTIFFVGGTLGVGEKLSVGLGVLIGLGALVVYGYIVRQQLFKRGHLALDASKAIEILGSTLQKTTQRKLGFQGVMIFKCPDAVWQQVVRKALSKASAVIIDVTELTENVLWELETTLKTNRPESVLLAFGMPKGSSEEMPKIIRDKLEKCLGSTLLARTHVFYYPKHQPPPGRHRGRLYKELSKRLSQELGPCIENTVV